MKPRYFATPEKFRAWLAKNHASAPELLVGFHKKATGKPSITWPQSVDEALCYGWIDGVRQQPRARELHHPLHAAPPAQHLVRDQHRAGEGPQANRAHDASRTRGLRTPLARAIGIYAYEQRDSGAARAGRAATLQGECGSIAFFRSLAPSYRQKALYWITSARKPETRASRLASHHRDGRPEEKR